MALPKSFAIAKGWPLAPGQVPLPSMPGGAFRLATGEFLGAQGGGYLQSVTGSLVGIASLDIETPNLADLLVISRGGADYRAPVSAAAP